MNVVGGIVYIVILLGGILLLVWLGARLFRLAAPSDAWRIAGTTWISPEAEQFYLAYIRRHTTFRRVGAISLGVLSVAASLVVTQSITLWGNEGGTHINNYCGPDGCATYTQSDPITSMAALLVPACVLGAIVGGLLAETYRLRPPPGVRQASLDARAPRPLVWQTRTAWVLTALAAAAAIAWWIARRDPALFIGLTPGLLAVGLSEAVQASLASRRRPVATSEVMDADRNLRRAIAQSVAWMELAAAILSAGWIGMVIGPSVASSQNPPGLVLAGVLTSLFGFFAVIPALICVQRSSLVKPPERVPAPLAAVPDKHLAVTRWFSPKNAAGTAA